MPPHRAIQAVLISTLLSSVSRVFAAPLHERQASLKSCLEAAAIPILTSGDNDFSTVISPFNLRLPYVPAIVAIPTTKEQVSAAVKCAAATDIKVQPRGGGHSYGAMGLGGKDGAFMIDMKRFQKIEVDDVTKIATVGPGVRLGNLVLGLDAAGKRAMPHGICPGVGVAGHALHGGFGFTSRMWGIAVDVITELEVVLANGTITKASNTQNKDLFWALKGAGSSFGIVTEFKFQTQPQPATGISFSVNTPRTLDATQQTNIFLASQEFGKTLKKNAALRLQMAARSVAVSGVYWGTLAEAREVIAPLGTLLNYTVTYTSRTYTNTLLSVGGVFGGFAQPVDGYNAHETFYAKSLVTTEDEPLGRKALESFFSYINTAGPASGTNWWSLADLYGGGDSEINAHSLDESSYAHRNGLWTFQLYANSRTFRPPYPNSGFDFVTGMADAITTAQPETKFLAYANYNDPLLSAAEAHDLYYGIQYEKLLRIKRQVDPNMLFWNPQAIGA